MLPWRWSWRTGAMKRSSAIWMSAAPSTGSRWAHCPRVSACRAKRPWPRIGLGRTSLFGERYVRSATGGHCPDEGVRLVWCDQPRAVALPLDPHEAVGARDVHAHEPAMGGPQVDECAE